MIDLKTLYEQITASFEKIDNKETGKYVIEIYKQPDTPILAFVYWSKTRPILKCISYTSD